jgi:flavorubredoxin
MKVTKDIKYIGVNDHDIDLFEGQYIVPNGMSYNSYVILDEKIAVMDSVDINFKDEWLNNLEKELNGRTPDYLVVQHMEPYHSACIKAFMDKYDGCVIVSSLQAFKMINQFYKADYENRRLVVGEGAKLSLGKHELTFMSAPMVHWPEVIVTYDTYDKVLFTADGFGKFGALDVVEEWACEARRYYFGIVGKYGVQTQNLLKKVKALDISMICPLHGPVLDSNLNYYLDLYDKWSSYTPENEGVVIAYSSVYGNTKKCVELLEEELISLGQKVSLIDLARCDMAEAIEDAFRYDRLVLASMTYNNDIFPHMRNFIEGLIERNYQNRTLAFIENGSWSPQAAKVMKAMFEKSKNICYVDNVITIYSSMSEKNIIEVKELASILKR